MSTLEIRSLRKKYGALEILKGIDISLEKGGFLVLVGPSGCGKSTLLNTIAGLESITSGEIRIGGQVVNNLHPSKRDIAMVFQSYALYPNMSVARERGVRHGDAWRPEARARQGGRRGRKDACRSSICWTGAQASFRAANDSASRWAGLSCGSRRCSCSMSRSRTSTPNFASTCASRSNACTSRRARPSSMSRMTRSKR